MVQSQILKMLGVICAKNNVKKCWQNPMILSRNKLDKFEFHVQWMIS